MGNWFKRATSVALGATLLVTALTGCSFGSKSGQATEEQSTLKVMYYDESSFFQEYGMLFSALYPNIDIEVVSTQSLYRGNSGDEEFDYEKAKQEFLEKEKPDILMLDIGEFEQMAQDGKLLDLDTFVARDKYDVEGFIPGAVDYMKELGGGQFFGMPSNFNSQVIYYNKDLFDRYNVEYPRDKMSWSEVLHLARQFPTDGDPEDRVYGMRVGYSGDLNELVNMLASSEGLNYVNPSTKTMTINTAGWKNVLNAAHDAIKSDTLYYESRDSMMGGFSGSYEDYLMRNPFLSGRLAMLIEGNYLMDEIKRAKEYITEEGRIVENWDMVTSPVSSQYPDESSTVWYGNILAISNESTNREAAWQFLSYIFGDDFARVKSMVNYGNFSLRTAYADKEKDGRNYAAFYQLKPSRQQMDYKEFEKLPPQFNMMFYGMMSTEFQAVESGQKSVEEALELLQVKGEELLAQEPMSDEELMEWQQRQWEEQYGGEMEMLNQAAGIGATVEVNSEEEAAQAE